MVRLLLTITTTTKQGGRPGVPHREASRTLLCREHSTNLVGSLAHPRGGSRFPCPAAVLGECR